MSEKPIDNGLYGSWRDLYDEPDGPSVMPSVPRAEESKTAAPRVPEHVMAELLGQVNAPFNHELVINRMYDVVLKLNDRLGAYGLVVGDDRRGRFPAVAMWHLVNMRRAELGLEPKAEIRFMYGRYEGELPEDVVPPKLPNGVRALIVTEVVKFGTSASNLLGVITRAGEFKRTDVDVASLEAWQSLPAANFFYGGAMRSHDETTDANSVDPYFFDISVRSLASPVARNADAPKESYYLPQDGLTPEQTKAYQDAETVARALYGLLSPVDPVAARRMATGRTGYGGHFDRTPGYWD